VTGACAAQQCLSHMGFIKLLPVITFRIMIQSFLFLVDLIIIKLLIFKSTHKFYCSFIIRKRAPLKTVRNCAAYGLSLKMLTSAVPCCER
jgi:hypothetical protein